MSLPALGKAVDLRTGWRRDVVLLVAVAVCTSTLSACSTEGHKASLVKTTLVVAVRDLPPGIPADVTIRGRGGFRRHVTASARLTGIAPGRYAIESHPVHHGDVTYASATIALSARVQPGRRTVVAADYAEIVPDTTKVVRPGDLDLLEVASASTSTLVLRPSAPAGLSLRSGDVIVSSVSPQTPSGLLRRVVAVERRPDRVLVHTAFASLRDAMPRARFHLHADVGQRSRTLVGGGPGRAVHVRVRSLDSNDLGSQDLKSEFDTSACDSGRKIRPDVKASAHFTFDHDIQWGWFSPDYMRFVGGVDEQATVDLFVGAQEKCHVEGKFPETPLSLDALVFLVGVVPIVVVPQIDLHGTLDGSLRVGGDIGLRQEFSAHAGFEYRDDNFLPISDAKFTPHLDLKPRVKFSADLQAGPRFTAAFYGIGGPDIEADTGLKAEVDQSGRDTEMKVKAGVYARVGAHMDILGWQKGWDSPGLTLKESTIFSLKNDEATTTTTSATTASSTATSTTATSTTATPSGPGTASGTSSTTGPSTTAGTAPSGSPTTVKKFEPWTAAGPSPSLVVTTHASGSCDSGSSDDPGSSLAVRCTPPGNGTPCFIDDTGGGDPGAMLLCSNDPTSTQVTEVTPMPPTPPFPGGLNSDDPSKPPWFLILADGRKCNLLGYGTNADILSYDCGGNVGTTVPDRAHQAWTVREGVEQANPTPSSTPVAVVTAYR